MRSAAFRSLAVAAVDQPGDPVVLPAADVPAGVSAGRLDVSPTAAYGVEAVLGVLRAAELDVITLRYPGSQVGWFAALVEMSGYRVVHSYSQIFLRHRLPVEREVAEPPALTLRVLSPREAGELRRSLLDQSGPVSLSLVGGGPLSTPWPGLGFAIDVEDLTATVLGRMVATLATDDATSPRAALGLDVYERPGGVIIGEVAGALVREGAVLADVVTDAVVAIEAVVGEAGANRHVVRVDVHDVTTTTRLADLGYRIIAEATVVTLWRR